MLALETTDLCNVIPLTVGRVDAHGRVVAPQRLTPVCAPSPCWTTVSPIVMRPRVSVLSLPVNPIEAYCEVEVME